jgi:hypothetical protein
MYKAIVVLWDCFVVGYGDKGPEYQCVSAQGVALNHSPEKAVAMAREKCLQAFRPQIPEVYYNCVDNPPMLTLYKGTTLLCKEREISLV